MDVFDAAKELFGYNREGFFFDSELRLKREYQEQILRVKQFVLYREDVRDLTELTTSKMDSYLLVALLELGCCFDLLVHGVLHLSTDDAASQAREQTVQPTWLLWLYVISLAEAFLYLFLSAWFAIHASVAAHSFAVRLLTQFVRLPVPDRSKLDAARAYAAEFEGGGVESLMRVPLLGRQLDNLEQERRGEDGGQAVTENIGMALATLNEGDPNPARTLRHVKLYRDLQSNWQAHDAYARACLALGTYTLVHAIAYYAIGYLVVRLHSVWPALGCSVLLPVLAWLLMRLDLYFGSYAMVLWALFMQLGPVLAWVAATLAVLEVDWMETFRNTHTILVPVIFLLHVFLIGSIVLLSYRSDHDTDRNLTLPTRFRTVLYLDVFGWVNDPEATARLQERTPAGAAAGAAGDGSPRRQRMSPQLQESLRAECRQIIVGLEREFRAWRGQGARDSLQAMPALAAELRDMEAAFERMKEENPELRVLVQQPSIAEEQDLREAGEPQAGAEDLWLKLAVDGSVEYFVSSSTGEARREAPAGAHISDMMTLRYVLAHIAAHCELLRSGTSSTLEAGAAASSASIDEAHRATWPLPGRTNQLSVASSSGSVVGRPPRHSQSVGAVVASAEPEAGAQETRFGGAEAAHVEELGGGYSHSPAVAQTFHPRQDGRPESRRPPGQVPWATFCYSSIVVGSVWLIGAASYSVTPFKALGHDFQRMLERDVVHVEGGQLLLTAGAWPGRPTPVRPVALACHADHGPVAFLVERYGVHEVQLDGALAPPQQRVMQSAAAHACLAHAPEFHSAGLSGATLECSAAGRCSLLLFGEAPNTALRCPLGGRARSAVPPAVVALQPSRGRTAATTQPLQAKSRQDGEEEANASRRLPRGRRWAGACARGDRLYAAAESVAGAEGALASPELWGFFSPGGDETGGQKELHFLKE